MRNSTVIGRTAALAAVALAAVAVVVIVFSGGSGYQVKAIFQNASQIVTGDQVEVSGNPVGSVSKIALTPHGTAELTLNIDSALYKPLHQGTRATIRLASLSGIANRYVDLDLGPGTAPTLPSGSTIPSTETISAVDLDEVFNTLDAKTRKGLQDVFQGSASQYAGRGKQAQLAWQYLNPSIATSSILFHELNRDTAKFTKFVKTSSNLVTDLAERQSDLSGLVSHLSTTFTALANQQSNLRDAIIRLPPFMRLTNTTFVNLRNALGDLTDLINATKTIANPAPGYPRGKLYALLQQLEPLAVQSVPTIRDLANVISRPGANNDLIELNQLAVPLAQATVAGKFGEPLLFANGKRRPGAFVVSQDALHQSVPELAVGRPYAVDLTGWFEGYSHPGIYDANGGMSRVAGVIGIGTLQNGALNILGNGVDNLLTNPLFGPGRNGLANAALTTGQGDRCPGSMERGALWYPYNGYPCNPNEVPTGK